VAVAAVVLAACGGGSTATTERGEVAVVRIETRGGFTANTSGRARLPRRAADPGALGPSSSRGASDATSRRSWRCSCGRRTRPAQRTRATSGSRPAPR